MNERIITYTTEEKKSIYVDTTVYRFEFPKLNSKEVLKMYFRIVSFLRYVVKNKNGSIVAIIGYSEHEHWAPYFYKSIKSGGRKKVFLEKAKYYKRPHIHLYITGKGARTIAERLYRNQKKYFEERLGLRLKPFNNVVWSGDTIAVNYVIAQSSKYARIGNLDLYLNEHRIDYAG